MRLALTEQGGNDAARELERNKAICLGDDSPLQHPLLAGARGRRQAQLQPMERLGEHSLNAAPECRGPEVP